MKTFGLGKPHKLCSKTDIDALFARRDGVNNAILAYPLRAVWNLDPSCSTDSPADGTSPDSRPTVRFLISVPKKKLRHAVDRVQMRRRIREAYRLQRPGLVPSDGTVPPVNVACNAFSNESSQRCTILNARCMIFDARCMMHDSRFSNFDAQSVHRAHRDARSVRPHANKCNTIT